MLDIKRKIQITLLVLVLISSTLLGLSMESLRMILIGAGGAAIGFLITDWLKWFRIEGFLTNVASIVILFLAMHNFFGVDNTGKLVSVANLLVYLQTVLMFQDKTPRLIWQVLVLSLLQVVVGAIFSLNLEAGVLFLIYFGVAGLAMLLQSVYTNAFDIQRSNKRSAIALRKLIQPSGLSLAGTNLSSSDLANESATEAEGNTDEESKKAELLDRHERMSRPLAFFEAPEEKSSSLQSMLVHLALWIGISAIFTLVLFYMVPRHSKPWFGPASAVVSSVGVSKSVDLTQDGLIEQSGRVVFRAKIKRLDNGEDVPIVNNQPYFRGMALSSLVIEDGKTNWRAPHDRVFYDLYQDLVTTPAVEGIPVNQTIMMEETDDPLIYGIMPFYLDRKTPKEISFCHEVSAITRSRVGESIGSAPYQFVSQTLLDKDGKFSKAWPYISNTSKYSQKPMSDDPLQWEWLTQFEPKRYPGLVKIASRLGNEVNAAKGSKLDLFKELESYFLAPQAFNYTLDFREVEQDDGTDPIEDFCCNHKSGHCELFASALTIMLRQQNIPARLVVGFYGADRNAMSENYLIRERNAHAWVEAYLPPEDCTSEMFALGQAGKGGAWVILDPTPYSATFEEAGVGEEAIDLARTVWDDYVLGVDAESSSNSSFFSMPLVSFLQRFDVGQWDRGFQSATELTRRPIFKYIIGGGIFLLVFLGWLRSRVFSKPSETAAPKKAGRLRRLVAGAIALISPELSKWVMKGTAVANPTEFYSKLTNILERHELERDPSQTHREFAKEVSNRFVEHPSGGLIESTVLEVTELFNEVRFGQVELEPDLSDQIDLSLKELENVLA